ncbi:uncharacterized protein Z520_07800 [Fonsecaea multimorphosa CBS 102226]|uniref:Uncharacterized protein n=1 Tax=Fonsecaea multimorphosa CBS 102226 TaxID=1442371 RepID=A0A0D2K0P3_9EURO|nr:uncharacterized protein Z520_07800 [Fonsecaea multimorphosa CBS 102226]KIX96534.1 hypothetical protein Z520_07800 [Fonsecaea multimorphosa CBS 102226]
MDEVKGTSTARMALRQRGSTGRFDHRKCSIAPDFYGKAERADQGPNKLKQAPALVFLEPRWELGRPGPFKRT